MTRSDASSGKPLMVVDDRGVAAATDDVLAVGVNPGMPRREAEALAPFATVMIRDVGEETRRFESVVTTVEGLVPKVEVVAPGLVFVPVTGAVRFYGGEETLAKRVDEAIRDCVAAGDGGGNGWTFMIGIADGPFAARWAAATASPGKPLIVTDTISFLSRLDLGALREAMGGEEMIDTFRWLGISTLGDLARLPRETLASRFGNPGLLAHRLASGDDRMLEPREITDDLLVEMSFEDPLESLDVVAFAGRDLAEKLLGKLRPCALAPHAVTIRAESAHGPARSRTWRSADPFTGKELSDRVWWQLRAWVESSGIPGGITALRIVPAELSGEGRQLGLFSDESSLVETGRALARVQAILGPDAILRAKAQGGRMPAERVVWSRWGEPDTPEDRDSGAPWPGATPSPAPALVPPRLDPIEVEWDGGMPVRVRLGSRWEPVLTWSGPWRLSGRWWGGEGNADRYQMVTSVGAFLCVVSGGRAFLAGIYD
ncbi:MAG TPA: hypothetical protein VMP13_10250 [Acidimicrobiia bacterium]|nr:hypothetical protein [Acidimicrobiia bacterium]